MTEAHRFEESKDGWHFITGDRRSPAYATRQQAALAAELERRDQKREDETELETGLKGTFPASDPVSVSNPARTGAPEKDRRS